MWEAKTFARGAVSAEWSSRGLWQYNSPKEGRRRDCKLRAPHPVTSNQHRGCSSRAHQRDYTKTKPRGRSRCTSTREAPRNKSRGRADRTLVLGRRGAAAQNAGGRPGLPLNAPDTSQAPRVAAGQQKNTVASRTGSTKQVRRRAKKELRQTTPGTKEQKNLAQGFGRPAMGA